MYERQFERNTQNAWTNGKLLQFNIDDPGSKLGFAGIEKLTSLNLLPPQGIVVMAKWVIYMTVP